MRIELVAHYVCASDFVAAKIECSDDKRMWSDRFGNAPICLILFFLARQGIGIEIKKFSTIQTDSLGAVGRDAGNVIRQFNVCRQNDVMAILSGGRALAQD